MSSPTTLLDKFSANFRDVVRAELRAEIMAELSATMGTPQGRRWIDLRAVAEKLGCSIRQVHRYRSEGGFPLPRQRRGGGPVWFEDEIDGWMTERPELHY